MTDARKFESFADFWPYYLSEHAAPGTRRLHFLGTGVAIACLAAAAAAAEPWLLAVAAAGGYGPAWIAHFLIEKNRPATFRHPVWSLLGDLRMFGLACAGRLSAELRRHQIGPR